MRRFSPSMFISQFVKRVYQFPVIQRRWAKRFQAVESSNIPWTPLRKPLPQCRVALVTTGGVHLTSDQPFDMSDPNGDPTYRVIPAVSSPADLMITHDYYDHRDADNDINVVFPIDVLRWSQAEKRIGPSGTNFYSLMGHIQGSHLDTLINKTAPEIAKRLKNESVDVAIFTPA